MRTNRRYKHILATFMLLLYGFILAPVAVWHSHSHQHTHAYVKAPGSDKAHISVSHSCIICEHAYTPYISQDYPWEQPITFFYQRYSHTCLTGIYPGCTHHYNTRGSPAV